MHLTRCIEVYWSTAYDRYRKGGDIAAEIGSLEYLHVDARIIEVPCRKIS